jgi:hypothetical protein
MDEPQVRESELHPFEQFKATMRKLVKVSKADLDVANPLNWRCIVPTTAQSD